MESGKEISLKFLVLQLLGQVGQGFKQTCLVKGVPDRDGEVDLDEL